MAREVSANNSSLMHDDEIGTWKIKRYFLFGKEAKECRLMTISIDESDEFIKNLHMLLVAEKLSLVDYYYIRHSGKSCMSVDLTKLRVETLRNIIPKRKLLCCWCSVFSPEDLSV